ncbi:MAG: thioredoxin family protein [Flavobacterium sp.]
MKKYCLILLVMLSSPVFSQDWNTDFEKAKADAAAQNKNILMVFSGSDWCAPCIKLEKNIWESAEFKEESLKSWVLMKVDFPKKKANQLPEALKEKNLILVEKYNKDGFFPFVLVLDKNGKILGKTGYENMKPVEYIQLLHSFEK